MIFGCWNTDKSMTYPINRSPLHCCGIVTSRKHLLWRHFNRLSWERCQVDHVRLPAAIFIKYQCSFVTPMNWPLGLRKGNPIISISWESASNINHMLFFLFNIMKSVEKSNTYCRGSTCNLIVIPSHINCDCYEIMKLSIYTKCVFESKILIFLDSQCAIRNLRSIPLRSRDI